MLVSAVAPAQAKTNCDLIEAFTSKEGKGLRKLSIAATREGTFDVLLNGKKTLLRGANSCEIQGPLEEFELRCSWDLSDDAQRAESLANAYRAKFVPCLANDWTEPESLYEGEHGRVLRQYDAQIEVGEGDEVELEIEIWDFSGSYDVDVEITRD